MNAIVREEAPIIPEYSTLRAGMLQKWVRNFKRNIMLSDPYMYLNIDTQRLANKGR
ncbi:MAG: hypothetical protein R3B45_05215 [Bdellovibrionota bacterium]